MVGSRVDHCRSRIGVRVACERACRFEECRCSCVTVRVVGFRVDDCRVRCGFGWRRVVVFAVAVGFRVFDVLVLHVRFA